MRVGIEVGLTVGPQVGPVPPGGVAPPPPAFPTDATSGFGVPLTQADWDAVFSAAGIASKTLSHSWGLQDASGNPAAEVGAALTATGSIDYQQAVSGWTRTATRITEVSGERLTIAAGVAPNPASVSALWFAYVDFPGNPGANGRQYVIVSSDVTGCSLAGTTTPRLRVQCAGVNTAGANDHVTGGVRPVVFKYDRTAGAVVAYTDQEKIAGTYSASVVDGEKGFGGQAGTAAAAADFLLGAAFAGSNAEWSDADVKAVLQALGHAIPWS